MSTSNRLTDVVIVGAGPTGLMLALVLAKLGIDHVIVDSKQGATVESRAIGVQARTLEIYEQLGLVDEVLKQGTKATAISPGYLKKALANIPLGNLGGSTTKYPYIENFEQNKNERLLIGALRELGSEVLWEHALEGLEVAASGDGVLVSIRPSAYSTGGLTVTARYVVGADGASSAVRRMRDIGFEGTTSAHTFYVIDAADVQGLGAASVNIRLAPDDMLLAFPMGGGADARLIGVVPGEHPGDLDGPLRQRLGDAYGVTWGETRWLSAYRVHHRVAERFRDGPLFLAGDAAHVHSPVGAQGMNTGLQDAHNLALKLADVLQGRASDAYLDEYDAERRPVARRVIAFTERVFGVATSGARGPRFLRSRVVPVLAPVVGFLVPRLPIAHRVFGYVSQTRIHYKTLDARGRRNPVVGRRLPPVGANHAALRSMTWQVHAYGSADLAAAHAVGLPVQSYPAPVRGPLRDGWLYLVRPDGFVAAAGVAAEALVEALPRHPERQ